MSGSGEMYFGELIRVTSHESARLKRPHTGVIGRILMSRKRWLSGIPFLVITLWPWVVMIWLLWPHP